MLMSHNTKSDPQTLHCKPSHFYAHAQISQMHYVIVVIRTDSVSSSFAKTKI